MSDSSSADTDRPEHVNQTTLRRWSKRILYLMLGVVLGSMLALHLVPGYLLQSGMQASFKRGGLIVPLPDACSLSYITANGAISNLRILHPNKEIPLLSCEHISFKPSIRDFLFSDVYLINHMSISSTHIDLRLPQQTAAISWADYINQLVEDWRTHIRQHTPPEENLHYCISNMEIGGAALLFPQPSPLDINTFTLRGTNIGNHLLKDQNMELRCEFKCIEHAHGSITITANHQDLNFDFLFENVPSALLLDLNISEGANTGLRAYRPDGHMNIHLKLQFNNKINTGQVSITSRDLLLHPDEDQPALIRNIAKTIKQLRALEPQAEIKWSMDWLRHRGSVTKMNFRFNEFLQNMHQRIQAIEARTQP